MSTSVLAGKVDVIRTVDAGSIVVSVTKLSEMVVYVNTSVEAGKVDVTRTVDAGSMLMLMNVVVSGGSVRVPIWSVVSVAKILETSV